MKQFDSLTPEELNDLLYILIKLKVNCDFFPELDGLVGTPIELNRDVMKFRIYTYNGTGSTCCKHSYNRTDRVLTININTKGSSFEPLA